MAEQIAPPDRPTVVEMTIAGQPAAPRELPRLTTDDAITDLRGAWLTVERVRKGLADGEVFWRENGRVEAAASLMAACDLIRGVGEWIGRECL